MRVPRIGARVTGVAGARAGTVRPMVTTRDISYEADGRTMVGTLALPDGTDRRPGVLVCHEGPGLDDHARVPGRPAGRRAAATSPSPSTTTAAGSRWPTGTQMMARFGELRDDPQRARAIGTAGLDVLRGEARTDGDRLAAIGYCFGGTLSLELATGRRRPQGGRRVPLRAGPGPARGRPQHPRQGADADRRRRPDRGQRPATRLRGGDACRRGRLAAARLRRRGALVHEPARVRASTCRVSTTTSRPTGARGRPCSTSSTRSSAEPVRAGSPSRF